MLADGVSQAEGVAARRAEHAQLSPHPDRSARCPRQSRRGTHLPLYPIIRVTVVGCATGKPVPVPALTVEQPLDQLRERLRDDAAATGHAVAVPETVITLSESLAAPVEADRFLASSAGDDVPSVRNVVWTFRPCDLRI